jgi:hypothetical protein
MWSGSMKFRRKSAIPAMVDAEQYKPGMEEGFETRYQNGKKNLMHNKEFKGVYEIIEDSL